MTHQLRTTYRTVSLSLLASRFSFALPYRTVPFRSEHVLVVCLGKQTYAARGGERRHAIGCAILSINSTLLRIELVRYSRNYGNYSPCQCRCTRARVKSASRARLGSFASASRRGKKGRNYFLTDANHAHPISLHSCSRSVDLLRANLH